MELMVPIMVGAALGYFTAVKEKMWIARIVDVLWAAMLAVWMTGNYDWMPMPFLGFLVFIGLTAFVGSCLVTCISVRRKGVN